MRQQRNDIGFTFTEVGEKILPNGQKIPQLVGRPNNPEAHRAFIKAIEADLANE